jgi:hypothetical protein
MEIEPYILEKLIWSDADYDLMGWHDTHVHAVTILGETSEVVLDIDYILKWVLMPPEVPGGRRYYNFWVAPATIVFENVTDVSFRISSVWLSLDGISRSDPTATEDGQMTEWLWDLAGNIGISGELRATGYKQYFRKQPIFIKDQAISLEQRGGISFRRGFD